MSKSRVVYNNGINNKYFNIDDEIPNGYVKGGMKKSKTKHERKIEWHDEETKEIIKDLLKKHQGHLYKVATELNVSTTSFQKGMKKYYSDIDILDYVLPLKKFQRSKEYALEIYNMMSCDVGIIAIHFDTDKDSIRNTLAKFEIGNHKKEVVRQSDDYRGLEFVDDSVFEKHLEKYATTEYKSILIKRYIKHINVCNRRNRINLPETIEKHHILPSCIFKQFSKFNIHKWNMAILTPREHFVAHVFLHYIIGKSMTNAINLMITYDRCGNTKNNRLYGKLRGEYKKLNALKKWGKETSTKMIGSEYYNDGKKHKKFKVGDVIPDGWTKGSLLVGREGNKSILDTDENIELVNNMLVKHCGDLYIIADYYDVSYPTVEAFCKRNDIDWRSTQPTNIRYRYVKEYAVEVYNRYGGDWNLISEEIGVQRSTLKSQYKKIWGIDDTKRFKATFVGYSLTNNKKPCKTIMLKDVYYNGSILISDFIFLDSKVWQSFVFNIGDVVEFDARLSNKKLSYPTNLILKKTAH